MARKPRIHYPGAVYHVMLRGNAGQNIFADDEDRTKLLLHLQESAERFFCQIHAFCLMSNHIHLAIQVGDVPLSRIMQSLNLKYTRHYNQKQGVTGHLFQGRYKAILIDADSYLLQLIRYIHLNPVRVALVTTPEEYQWSSHNAYCGTDNLPWVTIGWIQSFFAKQRNQAVTRYRIFVEEGIAEGYRKEFHKGSQDGRLLGNDDFADDALQKSGQGYGLRVSMEKIVALVSEVYSISPADLGRSGKQRTLSEARSMAAWLVREHEHLSLTEFGCRVNRDISSLSQGISRLLKRAESDNILAETMRQVQSGIKRP